MVVVNLMGVKLDPNDTKQFTRVKVEVDCVNKIETLEQAASDGFKLEPQTFDLIYCGNILNPNEIMSTYGIKQGAIVHVLKKPAQEKPNYNPFSLTEAKWEFDILRSSGALFQKIQRLARHQTVQNILFSKLPGIRNDLIALAFLNHPELLAQLTEEGVLEKIIQNHQPLIDAMIQLNRSSDIQRTDVSADPVLPNYLLDSLSDHEMDSSSSEGEASNQQGGERPITAQRLAFALAQAVTSALSPETPGTSSSGNNSAGVITNEMFTNAMQQAFANVNVPAAAAAAPSTQPAEESRETHLQRYSTQLQQMNELGLNDVLINVQALEATGGDVQAAIDLVFSNFMSTDS